MPIGVLGFACERKRFERVAAAQAGAPRHLLAPIVHCCANMGQTVPRRIAIFFLVAATSASAQDAPDSQDAEARGLFEAGRAAFDGGRFEEALHHFERSYELSQRHELLFNIGHSAQLLGRLDRAIEAFEAYLRLLPEGTMRVRVEPRLAALREQAAAQAEAEEDQVEEEAEVEDTPMTAPPPGDPPSRTGPLALIVAGGALTVGGAISLALAAGPASRVDDAPAGTPWSEVADDADAASLRRNLGILLAAGGIAVLAAGAIWMSVGKSDTEVAVGPSGVQVRGSF